MGGKRPESNGQCCRQLTAVMTWSIPCASAPPHVLCPLPHDPSSVPLCVALVPPPCPLPPSPPAWRAQCQSYPFKLPRQGVPIITLPVSLFPRQGTPNITLYVSHFPPAGRAQCRRLSDGLCGRPQDVTSGLRLWEAGSGCGRCWFAGKRGRPQAGRARPRIYTARI